VWNALPSLPAVKNNRIFLLAGDEFVIPGPRIVVAAERFARTLHPEAW
jgi:ABC-type Fe3+-hydroxamate transport system substrate-binding protein